MNAREKKLAMGLVAVLLFGFVLYGGWRWFVAPLREYNAQIKDLSDANEIVTTQLRVFMEEREKLTVARKKSLPANQEQASLEYTRFLTDLLRSSGLYPYESLTHSQAQDVKMVAAMPGIKKTGHRTMTFTILTRGTLSQLVTFMERLQRTPYEHRIRTMTIDPKDSKRLAIQMILETMLVAGTKSMGDGPPKDIEVPMPLSRNYAKIAQKNIFVGAEPEPIEPSPGGIEAPTPPAKPALDMLAHVRLEQVVPTQQVAYLRNRIQKSPDIKLIAKPRSGYEFFRIVDDDTDYEYLKAKVLRVDARDVYFQVKDKVYGITFSQTLADAMDEPLSIERRDELDLLDLFDREWAKQETEKDDAKTKVKKKGR